MKRDMELIRKILFYVEENYKEGQVWVRQIDIDGYDANTIAEHILLAHESGFFQDIHSISVLGNRAYWVGNLSNEGYDFLDKVRNDTIWNKTKTVIAEKGLPMVTGTIKTVATAFITAAAEGVANSIIKNGGQV
ncbi:MAG: DUF2513 domain-containing protein [Clostridia bacterium]|nr:DUF2513 domain-containing protein [Clostridia bacterium]